jgi:feruloyl esterase
MITTIHLNHQERPMALTWLQRGSLGVVLASFATIARVDAQISSFQQWNASVLADAFHVKPVTACGALVSLTDYDFSITSATTVAGTSTYPEHCRVLGQIQPEIRFDVSLPAMWNGRLYMFGNGGYAGESLDGVGRLATARRALARGFAVAQTNTGHDSAVEPLGSFAVSPQKFLDYAYRAVHVTALTAKTIARTYFGSAPRRSYFDGCSTGGRQGLISAQRFPDDFDGILVGAPVLDFSGTMLDYLVNQRALAAAPVSPAKMRLVADAVYEQCDAADGVRDGVIDDPRTCGFKPSAHLTRCAAGEDSTTCFTTGEIDALETVYRDERRNGEVVFPGWPVGSEIGTTGQKGGQPAAATSWQPWFITTGGRPIQALFGETFFRYMAFGKPNPPYDWLTFDIDKDFEKLQPARNALDATDPDLSRFKARGGRILSYFGWADPALNPMMGVRYYEAVVTKLGPSTGDFYRLFMVPGMLHCGGGVGVNSFDAFTPLVEWVEKGTAPGSLMAARTSEGKSVRTRPLCPYPEVARYKGSGSTDEAANFSCVTP